MPTMPQRREDRRQTWRSQVIITEGWYISLPSQRGKAACVGGFTTKG